MLVMAHSSFGPDKWGVCWISELRGAPQAATQQRQPCSHYLPFPVHSSLDLLNYTSLQVPSWSTSTKSGRMGDLVTVPGRAEETSPAWRSVGQGLLSGASRSSRVLREALHLLPAMSSAKEGSEQCFQMQSHMAEDSRSGKRESSPRPSW